MKYRLQVSLALAAIALAVVSLFTGCTPPPATSAPTTSTTTTTTPEGVMCVDCIITHTAELVEGPA